ncbi:MlaD family protein [Glacieibacterium sp.]|uniref:MlaD family protein n=1 Tax=Glacieibacterium sp. TaxID=2860237 RepID=UPI003AFFA190
METRSSYVLVGSVVLAFTVLLFAAVLWLARFSGDTKQEFDILFSQSISGLAVGSAVAFNGVPAGKIDRIAIVPDSPQLVRVRISVDPDIPVLQGTTAGIEGVGFTGVSQIQLSGAVGGQPPIEAKGRWGRPIIPSRKGALGQLLASAPELLNNVSDLTASLNKLLNAQNRDSIAHILASTDRLSNALADRGPEIAATLAETRQTMKAATEAANALKQLVGDTDGLVNDQGKTLFTNLNGTIARANATLGKVDDLVGAAKPGIDALSTRTVPEIGQLIRDLRDVTTSLGAVSAKLDEDPASALLGGRRLPEYNPNGGKKAK